MVIAAISAENQHESLGGCGLQLAAGRKIRVLTVVDTYSRFSPAVDARFRYKGEDVVQTLERVCRQVGYRRKRPSPMCWSPNMPTTFRFIGKPRS